LTKRPAIPQQLYKTASRGLSAIAELLVESVLMLFTKNSYQNYSMLVDTTACHSWRVF